MIKEIFENSNLDENQQLKVVKYYTPCGVVPERCDYMSVGMLKKELIEATKHGNTITNKRKLVRELDKLREKGFCTITLEPLNAKLIYKNLKMYITNYEEK